VFLLLLYLLFLLPSYARDRRQFKDADVRSAAYKR
jgi:hypothetical protein